MIRQIKQADWLSTATDRDLAWPLADGHVAATVDEEDEELDEDDGLDGDDECEIDDLDEDGDYFDSQSIRHGSTCELSKVDE